MSTPYKDARLKIDRAKEHIFNFTTTVIALESTCTVAVKQDENGRDLLMHEIPNSRQTLDNLSLIAGDAIHNLHSALDFAWYSTISRLLPDKVSKKTKFPVRDTRQEVEGALHGIEVDTRCPALWDCIMSKIQPYNGGQNRTIWTLHDLDISDKHILLLGLDPVGHIAGISVRDQQGELHKGNSVPAKGLDGKYHILFELGLKVEDQGNLSVAVTFQEAGIYQALPVESLLSSFSNFTLYTVQLLENI